MKPTKKDPAVEENGCSGSIFPILRDQTGQNRLLAQILADQNLQQLVTVDFTDQRAGVVMVGDIGGILRKDIADDLVDGVVALFLQRLVYRGKDRVDLRVTLLHQIEFTGKIVHTETTLSLYPPHGDAVNFV